MLKRFAVLLTAGAAVAGRATGAMAAPGPTADGILPEQACHAVYPYHTQPLLCGRGTGGPQLG
jgi:hypothetical protein